MPLPANEGTGEMASRLLYMARAEMPPSPLMKAKESAFREEQEILAPDRHAHTSSAQAAPVLTPTGTAIEGGENDAAPGPPRSTSPGPAGDALPSALGALGAGGVTLPRPHRIPREEAEVEAGGSLGGPKLGNAAHKCAGARSADSRLKGFMAATLEEGGHAQARIAAR